MEEDKKLNEWLEARHEFEVEQNFLETGNTNIAVNN